MTITLKPEQEAWLATCVANGEFASVEEGALRLIDERILDLSIDKDDDLAWAKPYVDEALAQLERGETISLEEHEARMDAVLASLR
jgi:antitoxin ParD1/3/4